jgi:His-Xaa-Ser system protein HxsD
VHAVSHTVIFQTQVYSLEAVKKAAYRFSDRLSVEIIPRGDVTECICNFLRICTDDEAQKTLAAFRTEVLDHDLRFTIAKETELVRNAILAYAFSKTGLQGGE